MIKRIFVIGADKRMKFCADTLSDDFYTEYSEKGDSENFGFDAAVLPINPSCEEIKAASEHIRSSGIIFGGRINSDNRNFIDYTKSEEFSLMNAVPTAEGALKIALEELDCTLSGMKILIVGCGRIGTALALLLKGFGADLCFAVRSAVGMGKARVIGVKSCMMSEIDYSSELIFNTAPELIFDYEMLKKLKSDCLIIDLASGLGGVDFESAQELGIKTIHALGIPGKNAPKTAGRIIAETIRGIIAERSADEK